MSQQITEAFVQQFSANVMHLSQQKGSRLESKVRRESQKGESAFYDRIGTVAAVKRTGRHASTPQMDTPHSRRMVTMEDYEWADLVDDQDKFRMLIDPTSEYALAASNAFGRSKDDVIIASALASAYAGQKGQTPVVHPDSQKYACTDGTNLTNMNVLALRKVKAMFDKQEVEGKRYIACTSSQIEAMLGEEKMTNEDYAVVKALAKGEIDSFMGFDFIRTERLGLTTATSANQKTGGAVNGSVAGDVVSLTGTNRACIAWADQGLLLAVGEDFTTKMSERDDKGYAKQVYCRMTLGGTRMEEVQVIEIIAKEA